MTARQEDHDRSRGCNRKTAERREISPVPQRDIRGVGSQNAHHQQVGVQSHRHRDSVPAPIRGFVRAQCSQQQRGSNQNAERPQTIFARLPGVVDEERGDGHECGRATRDDPTAGELECKPRGRKHGEETEDYRQRAQGRDRAAEDRRPEMVEDIEDRRMLRLFRRQTGNRCADPTRRIDALKLRDRGERVHAAIEETAKFGIRMAGNTQRSERFVLPEQPALRVFDTEQHSEHDGQDDHTRKPARRTRSFGKHVVQV